jgi:hypothetical protein
MRELAVRPLLDDPLDAVTWLGDITAVVRAKSPARAASRAFVTLLSSDVVKLDGRPDARGSARSVGLSGREDPRGATGRWRESRRSRGGQRSRR